MRLVIELLLVALLLVGVFFTFLGAFSLVKLDTFFRRIHGPTKASTMGVGCILIVSIVYHTAFNDSFHPREILITVFLLLTAPVSAHLMSRAALSLMRADPNNEDEIPDPDAEVPKDEAPSTQAPAQKTPVN